MYLLENDYIRNDMDVDDLIEYEILFGDDDGSYRGCNPSPNGNNSCLVWIIAVIIGILIVVL